MSKNNIYIWIAAIAYIIWVAIAGMAYGDDSELCVSHCNDQKIEDLSQALEIWNAANCSVRDICTVQQDCSTDMDFVTCECDPNDEALNITGRCDPDWNDTGEEEP